MQHEPSVEASPCRAHCYILCPLGHPLISGCIICADILYRWQLYISFLWRRVHLPTTDMCFEFLNTMENSWEQTELCFLGWCDCMQIKEVFLIAPFTTGYLILLNFLKVWKDVQKSLAVSMLLPSNTSPGQILNWGFFYKHFENTVYILNSASALKQIIKCCKLFIGGLEFV